MASCKSFLLLFCFLLALVIMVSAEVSTSLDDKKESGVNAEVDQFRGPRRGFGRGRGRGGGRKCCKNAYEDLDAEFEDDIRN